MRHANAALLAGLVLVTAPVLALAAQEGTRSWHFTVLIDGKRIGEHDFIVARRDGEVIVDTKAHFKAALAFIPLYVYDHEDHEIWRDGCVVSLASRTDDNGRKDFVEAELKDQVLQVRSARARPAQHACVRTFAYWDASLLAQPPLLNSQTGEFQSVTLSAGGEQSVSVRGQLLRAKRFALKGSHLAIDLWYADSGEWVALESKLESGRTLRYEIR